MIDRGLDRRATNADTQARDRIGAELNNNRFQAVVAAGATIRPKPQTSKWQRKIVENYQDFVCRNFVKLSDGKEGKTASVHEAHRFYQQNIPGLRHMSLRFARLLPGRAELRCQAISDYETNIMTGLSVF